MSIQYTWSITNMYTMPQGSVQNFVVNALFKVEGTDGTHTASIGGNQLFSFDSEKKYTDFSKLTEKQVIGWVQEAIGTDGVSNFEANVDGQIESMVNPPVSPEVTPLPWSK